jgi:pyridoxal biosynthesis lyase PdxS
MIKAIVDAVTIPVMAKVRIGHFVEAQVELPAEFVESPFTNVMTNTDPPSYRC